MLPLRRSQRRAEPARVERREAVGPPQRGEGEDRPVTEARLEHTVQFGETGADIRGHGRRLGHAVLDVKDLPYPLIGSQQLAVALGPVSRAGRPRLGALRLAALMLAFACLPRTLTLCLGPDLLLPRHADPPATAVPALVARVLMP